MEYAEHIQVHQGRRQRVQAESVKTHGKAQLPNRGSRYRRGTITVGRLYP